MVTFTKAIYKSFCFPRFLESKEMKYIPYVIVSMLVLSLAFAAQGQRKGGAKTPTTKPEILSLTPPKQKRFETEPKIRDFAFVVNLEADGRATVAVQVNEINDKVDVEDLDRIYEGFASSQRFPSNNKEPAFDPIIIIRPSQSILYKDLMRFVEPLRKFGPNRIKVLADQERFVIVPARVRKEIASGPIFPNPLRLTINVTADNQVTLNADPCGSLSDLSQLSASLKRIFRDREANGVIRETTNDIEKSVYIRLPDRLGFADVVKLAATLRQAGADLISFDLGPDPDVKFPIFKN